MFELASPTLLNATHGRIGGYRNAVTQSKGNCRVELGTVEGDVFSHVHGIPLQFEGDDYTAFVAAIQAGDQALLDFVKQQCDAAIVERKASRPGARNPA